MENKKVNLKRRREIMKFMMFAFIPLFAFLTVLVVPFLMGLFYTFTDWDGLDVNGFVGLANYVEAFQDEEFWGTLAFTAKYVVATVVVTNIVSFGLALLVTSKIKTKNVLRTTFFMPNLIGGVILGFIWQFMFSRLLVFAGETLNIEFIRHSWLVDPTKAFWAMVIVAVWQMSGYMMIIYITGLLSINNEVLEAAQIDGATKAKTLWYIRIPLMVQSFTISLFLTIKNSFMVYDVNLALTNGGPYRSTELISMHIYNEAFKFSNYGTGQAKAVLLFLIVAVVAVVQVAISKRMEVEQ